VTSSWAYADSTRDALSFQLCFPVGHAAHFEASGFGRVSTGGTNWHRVGIPTPAKRAVAEPYVAFASLRS